MCSRACLLQATADSSNFCTHQLRPAVGAMILPDQVKQGTARELHKNSVPAAGENGEHLTLLDLFRQGVYEGGEEEAIEAYEEAMEAIFGMHVASHRHTQCTYSKKRPGHKRFVMFEMWPLAVRCLPL